jgi:hypothetical protein
MAKDELLREANLFRLGMTIGPAGGADSFISEPIGDLLYLILELSERL